MKLLVAIASTLLFVLVSQQFASALPLDGLNGDTTEEPMAEHDMVRRTTLFPLVERAETDLSGTSVETPTAQIKREVEEPRMEDATSGSVEESVDESEKNKRAKKIKVIEKEEPKEIEEPKKVKVTVEEKSEKITEEEHKEIEEPTKETPKKVKVTVEDKSEKVTEEEHKEIEEPTKETPKKVKVTVEGKSGKVTEEEHKEIEEPTNETPKKVKVTVEEDKVEKVKEEEEHKEIEESTKEIPKKVEVAVDGEKPTKIKVSTTEEKSEKVEEKDEDRKEIPKKVKVAVEEEKPKKFQDEKSEESKGETIKESDFCPEDYAKFEDSCLFVGKKAKVSARSAKISSSSPMTNLVENIPVGADGSCPPGTEHTERGVCQKLLTQEELKLKKVDRGCPENSRLVDGQCIFHSFDQTTSSMELPLETSERMEIQPEIHHEEEYSTAAAEQKVIVELGFETTMQTALKA